MFEEFEYQVCRVQFSRVTFVNGSWQGTIKPTEASQDRAMGTCPYVWDYLQQAGQDGWELVAALDHSFEGNNWQVLFLKRKRRDAHE